jgi:hypothetical protein
MAGLTRRRGFFVGPCPSSQNEEHQEEGDVQWAIQIFGWIMEIHLAGAFVVWTYTQYFWRKSSFRF